MHDFFFHSLGGCREFFFPNLPTPPPLKSQMVRPLFDTPLHPFTSPVANFFVV